MIDQDQQSSKGGSNYDIKKVSEGRSPKYRLDMDEKKQLYNVKVIWVIGVPGSGKGTQLKKISEKYNCTLIGGGDLMRKEISENTDIGKEIKKALEEGRKPSKEVVWDLVIHATKMALAEKNDYIFFDGAPRDSSQVEKFEEYIKPCDLILNLEIDTNTSMSRIQQRAKIEGRIDDQDMKIVENRLAEYQRNIDPILKQTRDRHYKYAEIDADKTEDEVFKDICIEIERLNENNSSKDIFFGTPWNHITNVFNKMWASDEDKDDISTEGNDGVSELEVLPIVDKGITMDKIWEILNLIHSKLDLIDSNLNLLNAKLENLDPKEKRRNLI